MLSVYGSRIQAKDHGGRTERVSDLILMLSASVYREQYFSNNLLADSHQQGGDLNSPFVPRVPPVFLATLRIHYAPPDGRYRYVSRHVGMFYDTVVLRLFLNVSPVLQ